MWANAQQNRKEVRNRTYKEGQRKTGASKHLFMASHNNEDGIKTSDSNSEMKHTAFTN
jgi:hypothetical protein